MSDIYLGRKDIVLFVASTLSTLFPSPLSGRPSPLALSDGVQIQPLAEWLAYVLYRTQLPNKAVFHSLELLKRLSNDFEAMPLDEEEELERAEELERRGEAWDPTAAPQLFHHRLLLSVLVIVTKYWMDDAYSNKSWSVASRSLFTLRQVDAMELSMLGALHWTVLVRPPFESDSASTSTSSSDVVDDLIASWSARFVAFTAERVRTERWEKDRRARSLARGVAPKGSTVGVSTVGKQPCVKRQSSFLASAACRVWNVAVAT